MSRALKIAAVAALVLAGSVCGVVFQRSRIFPATALDQALGWAEGRAARTLFEKDGGLWGRRRAADGDAAAGAGEDLMALPYVAGSRPASSLAGVRVHDAQRTAPGLNLFSSAHAPEAFLIDREGTLLHRWSIDPDRVWPELAALIPIPMHRSRFQERGFDQTLLLTRALQKHLQKCRSLHIPIEANLLRVKKPHFHQVGLSRPSRRANLKNAFEINPNCTARVHNFDEDQVLLIDDVVTTGATLSACADTLLWKWPRLRVHGLCLARTPAAPGPWKNL